MGAWYCCSETRNRSRCRFTSSTGKAGTPHARSRRSSTWRSSACGAPCNNEAKKNRARLGGLLWAATVLEGVIGTMATVALFTLLASTLVLVGTLSGFAGEVVAAAGRIPLAAAGAELHGAGASSVPR